MLVVIGIILVVIGLAAPMIMRAWRSGDRAATYNDLQVIAAGLEAYRTDHGEYPRVTPPWSGNGVPLDYNGARMLCRALVGPGAAGPAATTGTPPPAGPKIYDGKGASDQDPTVPGPGFRLRGSQGRVYGPYIPMDKFKMGDPSTPQRPDPGYLALLDRYGKPILYYPALGKPNIQKPNGFIADYDSANPPADMRPLYNAGDNAGAFKPVAPDTDPAIRRFRIFMGDQNANGMIDGTEEAAYTGPYLLWSTGPDEVFGASKNTFDDPPTGSGGDVLDQRDVAKCDDITNFRK
jgi:type II secretory pathway pseudopilin PulG